MSSRLDLCLHCRRCPRFTLEGLFPPLEQESTFRLDWRPIGSCRLRHDLQQWDHLHDRWSIRFGLISRHDKHRSLDRDCRMAHRDYHR